MPRTDGTLALASSLPAGSAPRIALHRDVRCPELAPGDALIRPTRVALDIHDLADVTTERSPAIAPYTLGRAFVGVVERIALPVSHSCDDLTGARVVASPHIVCGTCPMCRGGLASHCRTRRTIGSPGFDGCFADVFVAPARNLHIVPSTIDDDQAALVLDVAAAVHASRLTHIESRPYITVLGDDAAALICAQVMARLNASVRVLGADHERLALCERWGVRQRRLDEVGHRADQDIVIDCSGTSAALAIAQRLVRPRGGIILMRRLREHIAIDAIVEHEITVTGCRGYEIDQAFRLIADNAIDVRTLIGRRCAFDQAEDALRGILRSERLKTILEL